MKAILTFHHSFSSAFVSDELSRKRLYSEGDNEKSSSKQECSGQVRPRNYEKMSKEAGWDRKESTKRALGWGEEGVIKIAGINVPSMTMLHHQLWRAPPWHYVLLFSFIHSKSFGEEQFSGIFKQNRGILYLIEVPLSEDIFLLAALLKSSLSTDKNMLIKLPKAHTTQLIETSGMQHSSWELI